MSDSTKTILALATFVGDRVSNDPKASIDLFCDHECFAEMSEREQLPLIALGDTVSDSYEGKTFGVARAADYEGTPCSGCMTCRHEEMSESAGRTASRHGSWIEVELFPAGLRTLLDD